MGNLIYLTSLIVKKLFGRRRQSARTIFIVTFLLTSVVLALLDVVGISKLTTTSIDDDDHHNNSDEINKEVELNIIYQIRNQRIQEVCKKVKTTRPVFVRNRNAKVPFSFWLKNWTRSSSDDDVMNIEMPNTSHLSLGRTFKSMGCFPNKVASSSLLAAFLTDHGLMPTSYTSPHSADVLLQPKSLFEFETANATYFKFMFVRHPMRRMLSCYRDKMIVKPHPKMAEFWAEVRNFTRSSRRHFVERKNKPQLVDADQKDDAPNRTELVGSLKSERNGVPTFEEFLEFVLSTDLRGTGFDAHWAPYFSFCTPCSVRYDVIGKLETKEQDFEYIWMKTGLDKKGIPIPWFNQKTSYLSEQSKDLELKLEKMYYSTLPRELILRFYNVFRLDFELFDYSINEVILTGGHELMPITNSTWY